MRQPRGWYDRPRRSRSRSARRLRGRPCTSSSCPGRCRWSLPWVWSLLGSSGRNLSQSMADLRRRSSTRPDRRGEALRRTVALAEEERGLGELELEQPRPVGAAHDVDARVSEVTEALADVADHAFANGALVVSGLTRRDVLRGEDVVVRIGPGREQGALAGRVAEGAVEEQQRRLAVAVHGVEVGLHHRGPAARVDALDQRLGARVLARREAGAVA